MTTRRPWLRDPEAIQALSFARVRRATRLAALPPGLHALAVRLVHTTGDPSIIKNLASSPQALAAAICALQAGASILVDAEMVAAGITRRFLPATTPVRCHLNHPATPARARALQTTRSAAAVDLWEPELAGSLVAIGNAPTALFRLLEILAAGASPPACILGFCAGFVGAREAKAQLMAQDRIPWIALGGRRGGSSLAAAAVNTLSLAAFPPRPR